MAVILGSERSKLEVALIKTRVMGYSCIVSFTVMHCVSDVVAVTCSLYITGQTITS